MPNVEKAFIHHNIHKINTYSQINVKILHKTER